MPKIIKTTSQYFLIAYTSFVISISAGILISAQAYNISYSTLSPIFTQQNNTISFKKNIKSHQEILGVALNNTSELPPVDALIKGKSYSAVYYYAADGNRYIFPDEKTLKSWFVHEIPVTIVSDEVLANIPIRGNITHRPGVKMVKIPTSPKVYAVDMGRKLRWIKDEVLVEALYGKDWNKKIDDILEVLLVGYEMGDPITNITEYNPYEITQQAPTINKDRGIQESKSAPKATSDIGRDSTSDRGPLDPTAPQSQGQTPTSTVPSVSPSTPTSTLAYTPPQSPTSTPTSTLSTTPAGTTPVIPPASQTPSQAPPQAPPSTSTPPESTQTPASSTPTSNTPTTTPTSTPPTADTTAPIITAVTTSAITQNSVTISWITDEAADSQLEYGMTTNYGSLTDVDATFSTNHTVSLAGLIANTTYHYRVKSKDSNGNLATSNDQAFTTLAPPPPAGPPDLFLQNLEFSIPSGAPPPWPMNQPITVKVIIQNIGVGAVNNITPNFMVGSSSGSSDISSGITSDPRIQNIVNSCPANLAPGASCTPSFELVYSTSGSKTISVMIDATNQILESNENNNGSGGTWSYGIASPAATCTDTDGGINSFVRGIGTGPYGSGATGGMIYGENANKSSIRIDPSIAPNNIYYDYCFDSATSNQLNEAFCSGSTLNSFGIMCQFGCRDGVCLASPQ